MGAAAGFEISVDDLFAIDEPAIEPAVEAEEKAEEKKEVKQPKKATKEKKAKADGETAISVGNAIVWDIETGPRPWPEIEQFFEAPAKPGEFDPATVKYGNAKAEDKRREKLEEAKAKHAAAVAGWQGEVEAAKASFITSAALSPVTGRVLAIGYARKSGIVVVGEDGNEADMLAWFWGLYDEAIKERMPMVGFNIFGFDLPFIVRRSWLLDVDVPADVLQQNRYWAKVFVDLMQVWACGKYGDSIKLDKLAAYLGCARKSGEGSAFAGLWEKKETRQEAIDYLKQDVRVTGEVAKRMGVI